MKDQSKHLDCGSEEVYTGQGQTFHVPNLEDLGWGFAVVQYYLIHSYLPSKCDHVRAYCFVVHSQSESPIQVAQQINEETNG